MLLGVLVYTQEWRCGTFPAKGGPCGSYGVGTGYHAHRHTCRGVYRIPRTLKDPHSSLAPHVHSTQSCRYARAPSRQRDDRGRSV